MAIREKLLGSISPILGKKRNARVSYAPILKYIGVSEGFEILTVS
jgi:hypothetical protein